MEKDLQEFMDAITTVCGQCRVKTDIDCINCPARKTTDAMLIEQLGITSLMLDDLREWYYDSAREAIMTDSEIIRDLKTKPMEIIGGLLAYIKNMDAERR